MTTIKDLALCGLLFASVALGGCTNDFFDDPSCDSSTTQTEWIEGRWTLSGESDDFSDCEGLEDVRFGPVSLDIVQDGGSLSLADPIAGFSFVNSVVSGVCVAFTTIEDVGDDQQRIDFQGKVSSGPRILGDWEIRRGNCQIQGSFEAVISQ